MSKKRHHRRERAGDKRRGAKPRRAHSRALRYEAFDTSIGSMQRDGRFLFWRGSGDEDALAEARAAYLNQVPEIRRERDEARRRLEILEIGPTEIVSH